MTLDTPALIVVYDVATDDDWVVLLDPDNEGRVAVADLVEDEPDWLFLTAETGTEQAFAATADAHHTNETGETLFLTRFDQTTHPRTDLPNLWADPGQRQADDMVSTKRRRE